MKKNSSNTFFKHVIFFVQKKACYTLPSLISLKMFGILGGEVLWKRACSLLPFEMEAIEEEMHCLHFNKIYLLFCKSKCCFIMYYTAVKKIVKHAY